MVRLLVVLVIAISIIYLNSTNICRAEGEQLKESGRYVEFFKSVAYRFQRNGVETVARWPLSTDVCIFGNPSKYTKDRLDDFFSVIVINTILKFVLTYVGTVEQCPPGTRLYARFHSGETDVLETLKLDLAAIARIKEYKKPFSSSEDKSSSMNKYGYAKIVVNHNTNIFAYAAVNQFDRNETIMTVLLQTMRHSRSYFR